MALICAICGQLFSEHRRRCPPCDQRKVKYLKPKKADEKRWNSFFMAIDRTLYLNQKACLQDTLIAKHQSLRLPITENPIMTEFCKLLEPIKKLSDALCAEKYTVISLVLPKIRKLQKDVAAIEVNTAEAQEVQESLKEALDFYFKSENMEDHFHIASMIDPRTRALPQITACKKSLEKIPFFVYPYQFKRARLYYPRLIVTFLDGEHFDRIESQYLYFEQNSGQAQKAKRTAQKMKKDESPITWW